MQIMAQGAFAWLIDRALGSGTVGIIEGVYANVQTVPADALNGTLALFAVGIPLSVWGMFRLTRTPAGKASYAN
jgi:hypothetical protein